MENITYFSSEESETASDPSSIVEVCSATICKIDEGICQLRLDLLTFSIAGCITHIQYITVIYSYFRKSHLGLQVLQHLPS